MVLKIFVFSALVIGAYSELKFPPGFKLGAGTSAYQIEGAWNVCDKTENIWDRYIHQHPENGTADVASDSYHLWRRDVEIAAELGLQFYRFSISWSRLLPTGQPDYVSEDGKRYYSDLIDELLKNGIEPVVTIHHFDVPQSIQDEGGWDNPQMPNWFAEYARVVFSLYGDRVKTWLTINEPLMVCYVFYQFEITKTTAESYLCTRHILLAHAKAYRVYEQEFKSLYHGRVSIANHYVWYAPESENDRELAELSMQLCIGLYAHPIYSKQGGWSPAIESIVAENSKKEGYSQSILPAFTDEELPLIRGAYDFHAFNYYSARVVRKAKPDEKIGDWPFVGSSELGTVMYISPEAEKTVAGSIAIYPEGLRFILLWLKKQYGDISFFITENGYPTNGTDMDDDKRIDSIQHHLEQIELASEEGVNVEAYTSWSLIDTFEFSSAYQIHFAFYKVDFNDPERPRTPRKSAHYYRGLTDQIRERSLYEKIKDWVSKYFVPFILSLKGN